VLGGNSSRSRKRGKTAKERIDEVVAFVRIKGKFCIFGTGRKAGPDDLFGRNELKMEIGGFRWWRWKEKEDRIEALTATGIELCTATPDRTGRRDGANG